MRAREQILHKWGEKGIVNVSKGYVGLFLQLFRKFEVINLSSISLKLSVLASIEVIIQ